MIKLQRDIAALGGVVRAGELIALGHDLDALSVLCRGGRLVIRLRKGWYANPGQRPEVYAAWRAGGRLACTSALAHHGLRATPTRLHIVLPRSGKLPADPSIVVHWSRRELPGDRAAVSAEVAARQAVTCKRVYA